MFWNRKKEGGQENRPEEREEKEGGQGQQQQGSKPEEEGGKKGSSGSGSTSSEPRKFCKDGQHNFVFHKNWVDKQGMEVGQLWTCTECGTTELRFDQDYEKYLRKFEKDGRRIGEKNEGIDEK